MEGLQLIFFFFSASYLGGVSGVFLNMSKVLGF